MTSSDIGAEQIRNFRLRAHFLDDRYRMTDILPAAGACGLQNSPPGAWETALFNRVPECTIRDMERLLYTEKSLLQAWSLRGAPMVFPASESDAFLRALVPSEGEEWIYTHGIGLALDFLQMPFDALLDLLFQVMPGLDDQVILSKSLLDQTLAEWIRPLLPADKQTLWEQPSMYGQPDIQTVGGAVVSFLLRPCAFRGLVVFGERSGIYPSFTSYKNWSGNDIKPGVGAVEKLVHKFLHCYGPATTDMFAAWLGCSGIQARRMWKTISEEMEPVSVFGKKAFILASDKELLYALPVPKRDLLLLGGYDPFLNQRDRYILQPDKTLHKQIWKTVGNPGAIVYRGEIMGIWTGKKKGKGLEVRLTLWKDFPERYRLFDLSEEYAIFRGLTLSKIDI